MANINLEKLSLVELRDLYARLPAEIKVKEQEAKASTLAELKKIAEEKGFQLSDLIGASTQKERRPTKPAEIKYRHPENAELTWTGRGRMPRWIDAYLKQEGKKLEDLQIKQA